VIRRTCRGTKRKREIGQQKDRRKEKAIEKRGERREKEREIATES
jgi:hypothetical protein